MKRLIVFAILLLSIVYGYACTNLIVGKKASVDGAVMCSYNADSYGAFMKLCHFPAAHHSKGEMRKIFDWDTNVYHGEIPEAEETYNVIGNINEHQVTIGETTFTCREETIDTTGIIDYGSLIYIALQRSRTAREAIHVMTSLVEQYGYCSEGETFTICDPNEAWIMEMVGMGPGSKSAVWVARRIPDNAICAHANQSRIGRFPLNDKKNVIYSKNVIKYAKKQGWYTGADSNFSFKDAYARPDFEGRRFCEARVWSFFRHFDDSFDKYLPWALGQDPNAEDMPLWIVPNKKLSVRDVENCMRDHYEGTALAIDSTDIGGGIWQMPYRPSPLVFKVNGVKYINERPISTQQSAFTFVSQMRSWLPREIGGVLWFGNDDANMVAYTPVYCGNTVQPECYNTPGADDVTFSDKNAFWVCNWVSNMVYPRYEQMFPSLKTVRDSLDASYAALQPTFEAKVLEFYNNDKSAALKMLNDYSNEKAAQMLSRWKTLATYLIVKYNDMVVKPEENGHFKRTKTGLGAPVVRPGYPSSFAKKLIDETKDKYKYVQ